MNVIETALEGVRIVEPRRFEDERGWFMELHHAPRYEDAGFPAFVQDNVAFSRQGVLRGLHYQWPRPQGKLVYVLDGAVLDVAVDIRAGSPTIRRWVGVELSARNGRQLFIPEGFAHGYAVLSPSAVLGYKCTEIFVPEYDRVLRWDDAAIGIDWPVTDPVLSQKDRAAPRLDQIRPDALPR